MSRKIITIFAISMLFTLVSCGWSDAIKEADAVMAAHFEQRIERGWEGADSFYSDEFKAAIAQDEWENIKALVQKAHGKLKKYEQTSWNIQSKASINELSGTFVAYEYTTYFETGKVVESLTLFKPSDGKKFKILSHRFNSNEIQRLINQGIKTISEA